jgi:cation:H+ antiporter
VILDIVLFVVSLGVLIYASDRFIAAAESIGLSLGVSPFIIGVTIVAFGTSLPELATSIASVFAGNSQIVIGNVIGSNITNILLVLGLTAFIGRDILLDFDVMDVDMPLLLVSAFLLYFVISDLHVSIFEAILLLSCLALFLYNSLGSGRDEDTEKTKVSGVTYLTVLIAGIFIFLGAKYTITAISNISESIGIGEDVIALTAVALGTSLPEVMVSIAAARRGKHAIAVGNVLGSNIFNTYAVTGIPALIGTIVIPEDTIYFSVPFMIFVTLIFAFMCISRKISKWEGVTLLVLYAFFLGETFQRGI